VRIVGIAMDGLAAVLTECRGMQARHLHLIDQALIDRRSTT
jgi:hypothetical protein